MKQNNYIFESKPLREIIADKIRADIIKGVYSDKERLVEPKLAQMLGISRTPIREALRQLESEGFIEILPRRGAIVKSISVKDLDDLYAIKANLEGLAAYQATFNITLDDLEKLKEINEEFYKLSKGAKDIVEEYFSYNVDFHNIFILASKNNKLIEILEGLSKNFQRFRSILVAQADRTKEAYKEHQNIIKAFEKKDAEMAESLVRAHIKSSWKYLRKFINEE